jgi:hypothetical protein
VVEAARPVTANDVPVGVPIDVPFCSTV